MESAVYRNRATPITIANRPVSQVAVFGSSSVSSSSAASYATDIPHVDLNENITYLVQLGTERGFVWNEEVLLGASDGNTQQCSEGYYGVSPQKLREVRAKKDVLVSEIRLDDIK